MRFFNNLFRIFFLLLPFAIFAQTGPGGPPGGGGSPSTGGTGGSTPGQGTLAVNEVSNDQVIIAYDKSVGKYRIIWRNKDRTADLTLVDAVGRVIKSSFSVSTFSDYFLDTADLKSGVTFVIIRIDEENRIIKKLPKTHYYD